MKVKTKSNLYIKDLINKAKKGNTEAQRLLGVEYFEGKHVKQDFKEAERWTKKAVYKGDIQAKANLGKIYIDMKRYKEAHKITLEAAQEGDINAQSNLGMMYEKGYPDIQQDYVEAVKWLSKATEHGEVEAMNNLASHYLSGIGVEKDISKAVKLLEKSSEKGYAPAQANLGLIYLTGIDGISKDEKKAKNFILKAINNGLKEVHLYLSLAKIYEKEKDYKSAYLYYDELLKELKNNSKKPYPYHISSRGSFEKEEKDDINDIELELIVSLELEKLKNLISEK